MKRFSMTIVILTCAYFGYLNSGHAVGGGVGNDGGDGVVCAPSKANPLNGTYALDYLVFAQASVPAPVAATSYRDSLFRIRQNIARKVPELAASFDQFTTDILNTDVTRPNVWEPAPYALIELDDQALGLTVRIPDNCRKNGNLAIVQAVVRQRPRTSSTGRIIFKYMPTVFTALEKQDPLQLSFLLVHEWLWSFPGSVDRNRRLNWYFHSPEFDSASRVEVLTKLKAIGLDPVSLPMVVDASGLGQFLSLQQAVQVAQRGQKITLMPGEYSTSGTPLTQAVSIKGEGPAGSVIINGSVRFPALEVSGDSEIENVTLRRNDAMYVRKATDDSILIVTSGKPIFRSIRVEFLKNSPLRNGAQLTGDSHSTFFDSDFLCANAHYCVRLDEQSIARFDGVLFASSESELFSIAHLRGEPFTEFVNCRFETPNMCPFLPSMLDFKATGSIFRQPKPSSCR